MINPISFRRGPVTFWTTIVVLAVLIPLIVINETVPPAPKESSPDGVNLTQAWLDLTYLTKGYHPYNSHNNDGVRNWLVLRIREILKQNKAMWKNSVATVFDDMTSNFTVRMDQVNLGTNAPTRANGGSAVYFEGTNIMVYIRGTDDEPGEWWKSTKSREGKLIGKGGTLINAHYDS